MADLSFLLDEHYPVKLAQSLVRRGVDAEAVVERDDLRGQDDTTVLSAATREGRIVVTEDVTTFPVAIANVPNHCDVIFCDAAHFTRTVSTLHYLEDALVEFATHPPDVARYPGFVWWLRS